MNSPERNLNPPESREFTDDELRQAREELAEKIVCGKRIGGIDILACLDTECDRDNIAFLGDLEALFKTLHNGRSTLPYAVNEYLTKIAMRHLPDEAVEERAAENERERAEEELARQNQGEDA